MKNKLYLGITDLLNTMNGESIFVKSLSLACLDGRYEDAINEIYSQSKDNSPLVAKMVGENLLIKIEQLCAI